MDRRTADLKSTVLFVRHLIRRRIANIQETVRLLTNDGLNELAKRIRGHLVSQPH